MDTMLRKALWGFLRPLIQLITNLLSPEVGEEWEKELKRFLRKEPCWTEGKVTQVAALKLDRITFTAVGTGLSGSQWPARLEAGGHIVSDWARDLLSQPDYRLKHRLEAGKEYTLALVRGSEIPKVSNRTTSTLQAIGVRDYGPQAVAGLRGEFAFLIREQFTNEELEKMGLEYIAVLHTPIIDSDGCPRMLGVRRDRDGGASWVRAVYDSPHDRWGDEGAFLVLVE